MPDQPQRVAIITGGTRGIGLRTAERLADAGYATVLAYAGNTANATAAIAALNDNGGKAQAVKADVADENAVRSLFDKAEQEHGGVDVVVNAAGIMPLAPLTELNLEELDTVLRTNIRGTFVVDQQAALRVRPGGAIINLSSSVTRFSNPGNMAYIASKGAVEAMTLVLARELRGRDITVNAVAPGAIDTEMLQKFLASADASARTAIAELSPLERIGTTDDIAEIILFLAGPARWINGQTLYANGGAI
jgi:3-oxoacyl-[acyl-carrier protein] reductase